MVLRMNSKLIGSILLIVGTTIGAGMLALPIATATLGFMGSLILLIACWFVMTSAALLLLEVNLWLPPNSNLISMAKVTLGTSGQVVAWVTYLLLLYSLLCAYIAAGSDLSHSLLASLGIELPFSVMIFLFTLLFGSVVYLGIRSVDYVNRGLMLIKLSAYFLAVILLIPFISPEKLILGELSAFTSSTAIMVTVTSFGFAIIVPSLRIYLVGDVVQLRKAIIIGSLIPLLCYIAWDLAIMGIIPLDGSHGLISMLTAKRSTSDLVNTLALILQRPTIAFFIKLFTSVCVLTSFLGVSLSLSDFLADGLRCEKKGLGNLIIYATTFLPPMLIVFVRPGLFIAALKYAGIYCVILLILFPALMAWRGRYRHALSKGFQLSGGKPLLFILLMLATLLILQNVICGIRYGF